MQKLPSTSRGPATILSTALYTRIPASNHINWMETKAPRISILKYPYDWRGLASHPAAHSENKEMAKAATSESKCAASINIASCWHICNFVFMTVEVIEGIKANSLAILTDAAHLLHYRSYSLLDSLFHHDLHLFQ
ncbi:hypothetical protein AAHE18_16G224400 [Arachis hypogaea]